MGPLEAMRASWAATTGHKGNLFLMGLAFLGITLGGLLACCIGIIPAVPLCYIATAVIFTRLSGRGVAMAADPRLGQPG
jgi:uncharacterized membrane protein